MFLRTLVTSRDAVSVKYVMKAPIANRFRCWSNGLLRRKKLSIQVHPNDAQAYERGLNSGKEECWCVDDAAQLASCVPAGPWLVIPLEGPLICRDETVRMGDCILVHDLSCLNMSDDCRMLLTSWFMT
jgi:hypothetical protein